MEKENNLELSEGNVLSLKTCGFNEDISDKEVRLKCLEFAMNFKDDCAKISSLIEFADRFSTFVINGKQQL